MYLLFILRLALETFEISHPLYPSPIPESFAT